MPTPPLPLPDPEPFKGPAERRKGEYNLPPAALLDSPKTERKIDERELMDSARLLAEKCREFSVDGSRGGRFIRDRSSPPSSSSLMRA